MPDTTFLEIQMEEHDEGIAATASRKRSRRCRKCWRPG
jgi:hypothetical protein